MLEYAKLCNLGPWKMLLLSPYYGLCHFNAWAEDCSNSIANVLELLQSIDFFVKKKPNFFFFFWKVGLQALKVQFLVWTLSHNKSRLWQNMLLFRAGYAPTNHDDLSLGSFQYKKAPGTRVCCNIATTSESQTEFKSRRITLIHS